MMAPTHYGGGPPPAQYGSYPETFGPQSFQAKANGIGFSFKKRMERIDWRKIASIDVERISREMDFQSLQDNIMNITFCNIEAEMDMRHMDPNFLKLFKMAQLTIEYLLHSQDYLTGGMAAMQEKLRKVVQDHENTKTSMEKLKQEMAEVKKESHKRKKLLAAQQQILHAGANSYNRCPYCPKAFLNASFLQAHLQRRHAEFFSPMQTPSPVGGGANQVLENELKEIKERLRLTESQLEKERTELLQLSQKVPTERKLWEEESHKLMEAWKESQLQNQKKEIEEVRDMFMKELKEVNEKFRASEQHAAELQRRYAPKSNLGELRDDLDADRELLMKQREEVAMMKEILAQKLSSVETSINSQIKKQVSTLQKQQAEELNKLSNQDANDKKNYAEQIDALLEASRDLEAKSQLDFPDGEEVIGREAVAPVAAAAPSPPRKRTSSPRHEPPIKKAKDIPKIQQQPASDDEEYDEESELEVREDLALWSNQALDLEKMYGKSTLDSTGTGTGELAETDDLVDTIVRSSRLQAHLRKDPNILKGMKEELIQLLTEQLEERGIPADSTGISNVVLNNKFDLLQKERMQIAKKNKNFWEIRRQFERKVDKMAWERYIDSRRSPKAGGKKQSYLSVSPKSSPTAGRKSPSIGKRSPGAHKKSPGTPKKSLLVDNKKSPNFSKRSPKSPRRSPSPPKPAPRSSTLSTTASSTARSGEEWDTEDEEETEDDDDYTEDSAAPVEKEVKTAVSYGPRATSASKPQPKKSPAMEESDFDSEVSEISAMIPNDDYNKPPSRPSSVPLPKAKGEKVANLSRSIELQLSGRTANKPAGSVDTMRSVSPKTSPRSPVIKKLEDDVDDDSVSFSVSSLQELQPKPAPRKAPVRGSGETDFSTNTYGTSVWGSSKAHNPAGKSSVSVTDWDSDLDLDDLS